MINTEPPPYSGPLQSLPMVTQQQPMPMVAIQSNPSTPDTPASRSRNYWKGLVITGYVQVVVGVFSVLLGLLAIVFKAFMFTNGTPIWSGICFFIVTGVLGIASGRKQAKGWVIAYMVLCIITALVGCGVCIAHALSIIFGRCPDEVYSPYFTDYYSRDFTYRVGCSSSFSSRAAINILISLIGFIEAVVNTVGASLTCCTLCHSTTPTQVVTYTCGPQHTMVQYAATPQQQYIQQPQYGNTMYPVQQIVVPTFQPSYETQNQGQIQYQPTPDGQALPPEKLPPPAAI